jgi:DNA (cytosine-5)-methyltransferase 1
VILDLFAGAGGWDVAARGLGCDPIGIELDEAACATRAAAGLRTIRADVSTYPIQHMRGLVTGLIASPPCQAFSKAGKRLGLADVRGQLVYEVVRWADALRPCWIACEQVEDVAPIWRLFRDVFMCWGYSAWAGVLDAADYGVPQNRRRAVLLSHRDRPVGPPPPTHSRTEHDELFGDGRERWVSMAEALGWGRKWCWERPATVVMGDRRVFAPGHHPNGADGPGAGSRNDGAVKVELWELAVLQDFPPDYPWQGTKTQIAQQIGNAIPVGFASAVLREIV